MENPILQMLNKNRNTGSSQISGILQAIKGNPQGMYDQMMQNNPQFADFVRRNQGKSAEQIARENGIDPNLLKNLFR